MTNHYFEIKSKHILKKNKAVEAEFVNGENYSNTCVFELEDKAINDKTEYQYNILVLGSNNIINKYPLLTEQTQDGKNYLVWIVDKDITNNNSSVQIQIEISLDDYLWKSNVTVISINPSLHSNIEPVDPNILDNYYTKVQTDQKLDQINQINENIYTTKSETDIKITDSLQNYTLLSENNKKADIDQIFTKDRLYTKEQLYTKDQINELIDNIPGGTWDCYSKTETDQIMESYPTKQFLNDTVNPIIQDVSKIKQDSLDALTQIDAMSDSLSTDYYTSNIIDNMFEQIDTSIDLDNYATKQELENYVHSDVVYDKVSVDIKLGEKAEKNTTYTKNQVDELIDGIDVGGGGSGYALTSSTGMPKSNFNTSNNLDSVFDAGIYSYKGSVSAPNSHNGILMVMPADGFTIQLAFDILGNKFIRTYMVGSWGGWAN